MRRGNATSHKNQQNWAKKPRWQCQFSLRCRRRRGRRFYCPPHHRRVLASHLRVRHARRALGFCMYCLTPTAPGYTKCARHLRLQVGYQQKWRDKLKAQRGWRMVKTPC